MRTSDLRVLSSDDVHLVESYCPLSRLFLAGRGRKIFSLVTLRSPESNLISIYICILIREIGKTRRKHATFNLRGVILMVYRRILTRDNFDKWRANRYFSLPRRGQRYGKKTIWKITFEIRFPPRWSIDFFCFLFFITIIIVLDKW